MNSMQIISVVVFLVVMIALVTEKVHRTAAAVSGAVLLLCLRILSVDEAVSYIDFGTIGVLIGMMLFVAVVRNSGLFEYMAIKSAKIAKGSPWKIMLLFMILTAVLSAFLDNVTTVLLVGPMAISIAGILGIDPVPFLLTQILASNVGGTATLIGDPPNIMIGSAVKELTFVAFIENLTPVVILCMAAVLFVMDVLYRKQMVTKPELQAEIMQMDEKKSLKDRKLLARSLFVLGLTILGFFTHSFTHIESSVVALFGAFLLLLLAGGSQHDVDFSMRKVEWATIFFFIGLFVAVGGLSETGVIRDLATGAVALTEGDVTKTSLLVLWLSALVSSVLDNIPFVATMIPLIQNMGAMGVDNLEPVWWSLSLGACLGGNGTLVGASANLIVAGMAADRGVKISFMNYFKISFPIMIMTIAISTVYVYLRYLL